MDAQAESGGDRGLNAGTFDGVDRAAANASSRILRPSRFQRKRIKARCRLRQSVASQLQAKVPE
jgi:hypothetical protein